jgi:hypothetical protein
MELSVRLDDLITITIPIAHSLVEHFTQRHQDCPHMITCYRGEEEVAVIVMHGGGEDVTRAAMLAIRGFDADTTTMVIDSYTTVCNEQHSHEDHDEAMRAGGPCPHMINPVTGKRWVPGELEEAARLHGAVEKGWLEDALLLSAVNRAGDWRAVSLPYALAGTKRDRVSWRTMQDTTQTHGPLRDGLIEAMNLPGGTIAYRQLFGDSPDDLGENWSREARDSYTATGLKMMLGDRIQVALSCDPNDQQRIRRLRRYGNLGPQ